MNAEQIRTQFDSMYSDNPEHARVWLRDIARELFETMAGNSTDEDAVCAAEIITDLLESTETAPAFTLEPSGLARFLPVQQRARAVISRMLFGRLHDDRR